ncbi:MAG: hypothetical protein ACREP7_12260, partial [Lysobacter sp.]
MLPPVSALSPPPPPPPPPKIEDTVRRQVDQVLPDRIAPEQRDQAYELVQKYVNEVGGVSDQGITEQALPHQAAQILQDHGIATVARPEVIAAVDSQISSNATPDQRRAGYEAVQKYVDQVGGIGDQGIVAEALPAQAGQVLRDEKLPARYSQEVVDAVNGRAANEASFAQKLQGYELVQKQVDAGAIAPQDLSQRAGELMREQRIPVQVRDGRDALAVLDRDLNVFDTAKQNDPGKADTKVSRDDLQTVANDTSGRFSAEQKAAANLLLRSDSYRSFLDTGAN